MSNHEGHGACTHIGHLTYCPCGLYMTIYFVTIFLFYLFLSFKLHSMYSTFLSFLHNSCVTGCLIEIAGRIDHPIYLLHERYYRDYILSYSLNKSRLFFCHPL